MEFISAQEMKEIIASEEILDSAKALITEQLGDDREIRDAYFDNTEEGVPHNSVGVTLDDGGWAYLHADRSIMMAHYGLYYI